MITAKSTDTVWLFLRPLIGIIEGAGYEVRLITGPGIHHADLAATRHDRDHVAFDVTFNPVRLVRLVRQCRGFLQASSPRFVVCNDPSAAFITRLASPRRGGPTMIYLCHGLPMAAHVSPVRRMFYGLLERLVRSRTDAIIIMNEFDHRFASGRYRRVFRTHGVGVDTGHWRPPTPADRERSRHALGIRPGSRVVGFVGRLIPDKGISRFLDAARQVIGDPGRSDVDFVIAGDGPLREEVARAAGAEGRIHFAGYRLDLRVLIQSLDLLVVPTSYAEGLPRTILEAMAVGTPVLASAVRGCVDLIEPEVSGFLIDPSAAGLGDGILALLDRPEALARVAANALREAVNYDQPTVDAEFRFILEELGLT